MTGTRVDRWCAQQMLNPRNQRAWRYGMPGAIVVVAAALRLQNLGNPDEIDFDETYYVKDAWTMLHLGYEGMWPKQANIYWIAGHVNVYTSKPEFVAHPPLGKWIIALGLAAFGAQDPFAWRLSTAIVGVLLVVVTMLVARHLFRSTTAIVIAGGLIAIDGNAIVMSRVAILDGSIALFVLLAAWFVLLDRDQSRRRREAWAARGPVDLSLSRGPTLGWRPWLLAAGAAFGAASSVKWTGFYFVAFFLVYAIGTDALARRRLGIRHWLIGALLKQSWVVALWLLVTTAAVHLASWTGWFVTRGGYDREWIEHGGTAWTGGLAWVPVPLQNWWHYQTEIYKIDLAIDKPHPYAANPLTWPLMLRPTSMYYEGFGNGTAAAISDIANPLIWYGSMAAVVYLVVILIRRRDWRAAFLLTGVAGGYLPWLLYLHRTVFQFYTIAFEPFLVLGLTLALLRILGTAADSPRRRRVGLAIGFGFLGLAALLSVFWYPLWSAMEVPVWFQRAHYWLPSWK